MPAFPFPELTDTERLIIDFCRDQKRNSEEVKNHLQTHSTVVTRQQISNLLQVLVNRGHLSSVWEKRQMDSAGSTYSVKLYSANRIVGR